jgi:tetratricopeptide (TPR) repeat protein
MIYALLLAAAVAGLAGCGGDNGTLPVETDEPLYREGQQLEKQGRTQEALISYLKLISRRGDQAPESHLEAGVISLENIKDPIAAIYHFRRYLELEPNSHRAPLVREQLERAMREFASTLPAQHWESVKGLGGGGGEDIQKLESENALLRAEIATMRANAGTGVAVRAVPTQADPPDSAEVQRVVPNPLSSPAAAQAASPALIRVSPAPQPVLRPAPPPPAATRTNVAVAPHPGRIHQVTAHESLFSLSKRYYGTPTRWKDIRDANRDKLKGERPALAIGMELKIP